ncbi:MAG: type II toxin-antitoxin system VapB family antitoxin [Acetobacteraceae bacterium]|jgi:antitoxin VapB|nr:type II toxin-antitoxin system VapB family antitoxin [Acetobacteraceae bacterium]
MGQLNIKNAALIAEAKELAALLRTTATGAVRAAVQEKLAATKEARARKVAAIMEIGERASKLVPPGTTSDHSDLYDEHGLPR